MIRGLLTALVAAVLIGATFSPFSSSSDQAEAAAPVSAEAGPITHMRVCPSAPIGSARCHAHVRTDRRVRSKAPSRVGVAAPSLGTLGNNGAYDPSYLQSAYNLASVSSAAGAGQTLAIVDAYDDPTAETDLGYYRAFFGLPPCSTANGCFRKVNQNGAAALYLAANPGWAQEISLDLDMASAICPRCNILLVEANTSSFADLGAAVNAAANLGATAISNSYGGSEWSGETGYWDSFYNHPGIPVTASAGDNGYGVEFPAATSYTIAVGGTTLNQASNTGARNATETVWSGSGSGCSAYEPKPSWQQDQACARRTVADVAAVADPATGVWVYDTTAAPGGASGWLVFGGTSVASPIVAAIAALAADHTSYAAGLYAATGGALFDITSGTNGSCGGSYLCSGGPGYDGPSGNGSPDGVRAFGAAAAPTSSPTPTQVTRLTFTTWANASPASVPRGSSVFITASVKSSLASTALVDLEVYNSATQKVYQTWWDNQTFPANAVRTFAATWLTAGPGTYTVKIGIFKPGWAALYGWNDAATLITVT